MDTETFKKVFLPYHQKLYRIAYRIVHDKVNAEDIVQETYIKLWNKRKELDYIENTEAFSIIILRNTCLDYLRKSKNNYQAYDVDVPETISLSNQIELKDEVGYVKNLIDNLPEQQRHVMVLKHWDGYSDEEDRTDDRAKLRKHQGNAITSKENHTGTIHKNRTEMKTDEIKILIEAFYNGNTTEKEEQMLFLYFNSEDVVEELLDEKELFLELYKAPSVDVPPTLESKLEDLIDSLSRKEEDKINRNKKLLWLWVGSTVACIALLFSVGQYINKSDKDIIPSIQNTKLAENEKAYKEAQEALILLSSNFNKGIDQLSLVSTNMNKTNEILNRTFHQNKE